jgi:Ser/Thr protein kinase RdoA (MazF antagonist)
MDTTEKYISQVSDDLLSFLSEELGDTKLDYEIPPSQLQGGYDTSVFQFKLKKVHSFLLGPLVLRLFRKSHPPKQAIMESVIHNSLVDQGFAVPYVYYACTDDKYLDNVLGKDGEVTAILDWTCCRIGDPAMDIAFTLIILNAATKHIIQSFDSRIETQTYLDAYRSEREFDDKHLEYYQVFGCALHLFAGGFIWTQPSIQNELTNIIYKFSKISVEVPR